MPSKPGIDVASRLSSGSIQAGGSAAAPVNAPTIAPAVAPTESVSQPPITAIEIAVAKSPSERTSANASSALLLSACTQCRCPNSAASASRPSSTESPDAPSSAPRRMAAA